MKGIVIELPSHLAQELRQGKEDDKDAWEQLLALPKEEIEDVEESPKPNDDDDDDLLSLPSTMPAVKINWNQLLGYIPAADESQKVAEALWSSDDNKDHLDQLLALRVARHVVRGGDERRASQKDDDDECVLIDYPRFLTDPEDPSKLISTAQLWKAVLQSHDCSVVEQLLQHLRHCHKPLGWKYAMSRELRDLAVMEQSHQELLTWQRTRPQQLQELYALRETMQGVFDEAFIKVEVLEQKRLVQAKLAYAQQHSLGNNNDDLLDLFPREEEDDCPEEDEYLGEDDYSDEKDDPSSDASCCSSQHSVEEQQIEESATLSIPVMEPGEPAVSEVNNEDDNGTPMIPSVTTIRDSKQENDDAWCTKQQGDGFTEHETPPPQRRRTLQDYVTTLTTTELRMTQAASTVLEQKLQRIDELLETLQDEEWAAEENDDKGEAVPASSTDPQEFGVLDQILAMILGSTDLEPREQFREHMEIVQDWKASFGRLPPSTSGPGDVVVTVPKQNPAVLKQTLGIVDNVETDWDSDQEEEEEVLLQNDTPLSILPPPKVGLRPGGRLVLP